MGMNIDVSELIDVDLKGIKEKQLMNSYALFSGLKFKTTSYNQDN
jgi:hypothetical protein